MGVQKGGKIIMRMIINQDGSSVEDKPIHVKEYEIVNQISYDEFVNTLFKVAAITLLVVATLTGELYDAIEYVALRIGGGIGGY